MGGATDVNSANNQWEGDVMGILGDASKIGSSLISAKGGSGGGGSTS